MQVIDKSARRLNSLLRGELAAMETYQLVLEKMQHDPTWADLNNIQQEHQEAVDTLRNQVRQFGERPDSRSGAWGAWARLVEGTAALLGKRTALTALKEGERFGQRDYQSALADENLPEESRAFIRSELLPRSRAHLNTLDRLLQQR
jgi:demethoxyubiquinone hydroxylase (CLK1/Coq7/Cat5 family)